MKCPSCNKFAAYDLSNEPEFELDVQAELLTVEKAGNPPVDDPNHAVIQVTGTCRIVLTAECCGDELKEATFDIDIGDVEINRFVPTKNKLADGKKPCTCDLTSLTVEANGPELVDRMETKNSKTGKPIPSRYAKTFYGAKSQITASCDCGRTKTSVDWSDEIQAGSMDELT